MRSIIISGVAALAVLTTPTYTCAADQDVGSRFYGGISLGASRFKDSDDNGSVFKLYGGYQITDNFGAEVGYLRSGDYSQASSIGGATITQLAKTRAFYTAGTARWQLTESFSVNGLLGVAFNDVKGDKTAGDGNLNGDNRSVMIGIGAQYRLSPRTELTMSVDHLGKMSEHVSSDVVTAGVVMRF